MFEIHDSVKDLAGSTPTRRLIVSRALEYLDSLGHDAGGNVALQRELATAYEKIGDIQGNPYSANIGDTDGALTSYRKAVQIREDYPSGCCHDRFADGVGPQLPRARRHYGAEGRD